MGSLSSLQIPKGVSVEKVDGGVPRAKAGHLVGESEKVGFDFENLY